jgi:hypothetical protein
MKLGDAMVVTSAEPAGANCAIGGTKVTSGVDANTNSLLDVAEIGWTAYACDSARPRPS